MACSTSAASLIPWSPMVLSNFAQVPLSSCELKGVTWQWVSSGWSCHSWLAIVPRKAVSVIAVSKAITTVQRLPPIPPLLTTRLTLGSSLIASSRFAVAMPAPPGASALCGEGGADVLVEVEADVLPRFSHTCQAPASAAGCKWGAILMCPRGGELRTATSPGRACIAAAKASAAVPSIDCPGGISVGSAATPASAIMRCMALCCNLALRLCSSRCRVSSSTAVSAILGRMPESVAAMAASSSESSSIGHALLSFLGFSADAD
mmetsp:Transcript_34931/g.79229  ORF Transcript_34931/g.79229 Transcript_34931/m.79229 type:complete len:263 (-) Transcript_34931:25-813(-)